MASSGSAAEPETKQYPTDNPLHLQHVEALMHLQKIARAQATADKLAAGSQDPNLLNDVAYALGDGGGDGARNSISPMAAEELDKLRMLPLPTLEHNSGSAKYFLPIADREVIGTKLIGGSADSPETQSALQ